MSSSNATSMHIVMGNSTGSLETPAPSCLLHSSQEVESMMVSNGWKVDTENLLCEFIIQIHN